MIANHLAGNLSAVCAPIIHRLIHMASHREMHAVSSDPVRTRNLALSLLALARVTEDIFNEWELTFLRDIAEQAAAIIALSSKERKELKFSAKQAEALLALRDFRLSSRQAEKLFEIRDAVTLHRDIKGVSVRNLITRCYEARLDLDVGDEEFIEGLWKSGVSELRTGHLMRLKRCSIQLGELEAYM
jgi:GAF domain-containing protein